MGCWSGVLGTVMAFLEIKDGTRPQLVLRLPSGDVGLVARLRVACEYGCVLGAQTLARGECASSSYTDEVTSCV